MTRLTLLSEYQRAPKYSIPSKPELNYETPGPGPAKYAVTRPTQGRLGMKMGASTRTLIVNRRHLQGPSPLDYYPRVLSSSRSVSFKRGAAASIFVDKKGVPGPGTYEARSTAQYKIDWQKPHEFAPRFKYPVPGVPSVGTYSPKVAKKGAVVVFAEAKREDVVTREARGIPGPNYYYLDSKGVEMGRKAVSLKGKVPTWIEREVKNRHQSSPTGPTLVISEFC